MDQSQESRKGISSPFGQPFFVNPDNITYGFETYDGFDVRIVYNSGELKGEYHLKPAGNINTSNFLQLLKSKIGNESDVNLVDRSGVLNLDYPIYVIIRDPILFDAMIDVWKDLSNSLNI